MAWTYSECKTGDFLKYFRASKKAFLVEPYNYFFPDNTVEVFEKIKNFQGCKNDIYVATFVKAGSALIQEVVYLLNNGVDVEEAKRTQRMENFPYIEVQVWPNTSIFPDHFEVLKKFPAPRLIHTHLPYELMPPSAIKEKSKMIYVARNMKDVIVSYYHFAQKINAMEFKGTFDDFAQLFLDNKVPYCPFVNHVKSFWEQRHEPNILFLTYEDMRKDLGPVVVKVAEFLGKTVSQEEITKIIDHCSFQKMKDNPAVNKSHYASTKQAGEGFEYLRKGIVGDWKNHFSDELTAKFEKWLEDNVKDPELRSIIDCKM